MNLETFSADIPVERHLMVALLSAQAARARKR
jgi:hypothetical protein